MLRENVLINTINILAPPGEAKHVIEREKQLDEWTRRKWARPFQDMLLDTYKAELDRLQQGKPEEQREDIDAKIQTFKLKNDEDKKATIHKLKMENRKKDTPALGKVYEDLLVSTINSITQYSIDRGKGILDHKN